MLKYSKAFGLVVAEDGKRLHGFGSAVRHALGFVHGNNRALHVAEARLHTSRHVPDSELALEGQLKQIVAGLRASNLVALRHVLAVVLIILLGELLVNVTFLHFYYNYKDKLSHCRK